MSDESRRVGSRQWRALLAAEQAYPGQVDESRLREAVGRENTPAHVRAVLKNLVAKGLLEREFIPGQGCEPGRAMYRITELGAVARLGDHGGWRGGRQPETALIGL